MYCCSVCGQLELIVEHGYPGEEHQVATADGYLLTLHRMPHGRAGAGDDPRPAVLLQHGLLASSSDWLMQPPLRSLGTDRAGRVLTEQREHTVPSTDIDTGDYRHRHRPLALAGPRERGCVNC